MVQIRQQLALELMREQDIATVQEIERDIFATPWPRNAYYRELASRSSAHYVVLRSRRHPGVTLWRESRLSSTRPSSATAACGACTTRPHVTTIGVRRDLHHRGYGRIIFAGLIQAAYDMGAKWGDARGENVKRERDAHVRGLQLQGDRPSQGLLHGITARTRS